MRLPKTDARRIHPSTNHDPGDSTADRMIIRQRSNQCLTYEAQPSVKGGADMTIKLLGLVVVSCAVASIATLISMGQANAERQLSNPAVRMAAMPAPETFTLDQRAPAFGSAFLSEATDGFAELSLNTPPVRITDSYSDLDRPMTDDIRDIDLEFAMSGRTPSGLEVSLAPRAALAVGPDGRTGAGAGAEFRIGQGLRNFVRPFEAARGETQAWYLFAATDGSALTWRPDNADPGLSGLRFQEERVVVGDAQIGISTEFNGMQASLSLVNREITNGKDSTDQNFVGATLTWRR